MRVARTIRHWCLVSKEETKPEEDKPATEPVITEAISVTDEDLKPDQAEDGTTTEGHWSDAWICTWNWYTDLFLANASWIWICARTTLMKTQIYARPHFFWAGLVGYVSEGIIHNSRSSAFPIHFHPRCFSFFFMVTLVYWFPYLGQFALTPKFCLSHFYYHTLIATCFTADLLRLTVTHRISLAILWINLWSGRISLRIYIPYIFALLYSFLVPVSHYVSTIPPQPHQHCFSKALSKPWRNVFVSSPPERL